MTHLSFLRTLKMFSVVTVAYLCCVTNVNAQNLSKKMTSDVVDTHEFCEDQRPKVNQVQKLAVYLEQMLSQGKSLPTTLIEALKNKSLQEMEKDGNLQTSGAQIDYFKMLTNRLMKHVDSPLNLDIYFLTDTKIENVFAIPPNTIVVTEPFLQNINNEAQLAVVLAHEIGHLYFKHSLALAAIVNDIVKIESAQVRLMISLISERVLHLIYGNQLEEQADAWGLELAYLSDYDVSTMHEFWSAFQKSELKHMKSSKSQNDGQSNSIWGSLKNKVVEEIKDKAEEAINVTIKEGQKLINRYMSEEEIKSWVSLIDAHSKKTIKSLKSQFQNISPELEALLASHPSHTLRACISEKVNDQLIKQLGKNQQRLNESQWRKIK
jgi:hypothetical protein